jgi:hypothetical protein
MTNHVMLLSLYCDVFNPESLAQPHRAAEFENPYSFFVTGAVHGGMMRLAYKLRSVLELAVLLHYLDKYKLQAAIGASAAGLTLLRRSKL